MLGGAVFVAAPAMANPPAQEEEAVPPCPIGRTVAPGVCLYAQGWLDTVTNLRGGVRTGTEALGFGYVATNLDLGQLYGLEGWSFQASLYGVLGRQMSVNLIGSQSTASSNEAFSMLRLGELWVQKAIPGVASLRVGQIELDYEFTVSHALSWLVNGGFGYPDIFAGFLPGGGQQYPLPQPGIRLALGDPDDGNGLRLAMTSGNPESNRTWSGTLERINPYGPGFSFAGGIAYYAEAVFGPGAPDEPEMEGAIANTPRPWTVKLGGFYNNGGFNSVGTDDTGLSLANPNSSGVPYRYGSAYGAWAIAEGTVYRAPGTSLELAARAFYAPGGRSWFEWEFDIGLLWRGPFGRRRDVLQLGATLPIVGSATRAYNRAQEFYGTPVQVQDYELAMEVSYGYEVIAPSRLMLWPFAQAIIHPSARAPNPTQQPNVSPTLGLPDAYLVGLRITALF
jgi:porin